VPKYQNVSNLGSLEIELKLTRNLKLRNETPTAQGVRLKQRIRFPLFECLFHRISVLRGASRRGGGGGMLYVSGALQRTYTLFYPHPCLPKCPH
jgi:hypothetical protein